MAEFVGKFNGVMDKRLIIEMVTEAIESALKTDGEVTVTVEVTEGAKDARPASQMRQQNLC